MDATLPAEPGSATAYSAPNRLHGEAGLAGAVVSQAIDDLRLCEFAKGAYTFLTQQLQGSLWGDLLGQALPFGVVRERAGDALEQLKNSWHCTIYLAQRRELKAAVMRYRALEARRVSCRAHPRGRHKCRACRGLKAKQAMALLRMAQGIERMKREVRCGIHGRVWFARKSMPAACDGAP